MTPAARSLAREALRQALGPVLLAAAFAVVTALALRYFFAIPTPAELFADQATTRIPLPLFETMLTTFGGAAKHLYLISALVAEAALTAGVGALYAAVRALVMSRREQAGATATNQLAYVEAPLIALILWLLSAGLLAPLLGGGAFGANLVGGVGTALLAQVGPDLVFALSFIMQSRSASRLAVGASEAAARRLTRRAMLRTSALALVTLGGGITIWQALTSGLGALVGASPAPSKPPSLALSGIPDRIIPPPTPVYGSYAPVVGQVAEITTPSDFYYVSKNLAGDPMIDAGSWKLSFTGMLDKPYTLTYDQLRALPKAQRYHTLECISNEVGGTLMSNGYFTGVSLADALNAAGIQRGATEVVFTAADGYSDRLHLSQALDDRSLIVYLLDGQPLPTAHGYPARLLIPGLYGMKNGKWLTQLSVDAGSFTGYWEQRGWTPEAHVKLGSRIDIPHDGDLLIAKPMMIAGVAYSGANGIARVDVSVDGGHSWAAANLKRPLGALTWTLWEYAWAPTSGEHIVVVRAIDLDGNVQTPNQAPPLPDGSSGYHAIALAVR